MKKIIFCILAGILIVGCDKAQNVNSVVETTETNHITDEKKIENNESNSQDSKKEAAEEVLSFYNDMEKNHLILKDLLTGTVKKEIKLGKKDYVAGTYQLQNGYCVNINESTREIHNQKVQGVVISDTLDEDEINASYIIFYDKELNETDRIELKKAIPEKIWKIVLSSSSPTVSLGGNRIAWQAWNGSSYIICYNKESKKIEKYNQFSKNNISLSTIGFVGNDKIAFYGDKGITETDTCYGYLDLNSNKITYFEEKNYDAFSLHTDERYMWLNDGEDPYSHTSSGKLVLLDTETGENRVINLDGLESTQSRITKDGKNIIAVKQDKEQSFRVRQYDVVTGNKISEKDYNMGGKVSDIVFTGNDNIYGIVVGTEDGETVEQFNLK